jgi:hypothetical protein
LVRVSDEEEKGLKRGSQVDPSLNPEYVRQRDHCFSTFDAFDEDEQLDFVNEALRRMSPNQHSYVYCYLGPTL